ncbi:VOC family protein [Candidatus Saccharibacteria bacterium]|nr:VOC family protein [Candidatus Saccharibacteria bacterium]
MIKKLDIITLYVTDHLKSAEFYEDLGLSVDHSDDDIAIMDLNGFKLWLVNQATAKGNKEFEADALAKDKGAGLYIYLNVDEIDGFYRGLVDKGLKPSSEPRDWPWGNREFVLRDPDGYKLCFYKSLKGV